MKAYSYDKLGDSLNAKKYFDEFFSKVNPDKIGPKDYATYGKILLKFPGNDSLASVYIDKAITLDTVPANKLDYIRSTAESLIAAQKYNDAGKWYAKILNLKKDYGKVDLYYAGYNYYRGGNYQASDSIFGLYQQKYPEDIFGWYMGARAKEGIDSTGANGLAMPDYEKVISIADTSAEKDKVKTNEITAYRYMVAYYYNVKHDKQATIDWNKKILVLDPTDAQAIQNEKALTAEPAKPSKPVAKPAKPVKKSISYRKK